MADDVQEISIPEAVKQLLEIVERLAHTHRGRKAFTLDGRLVGDIGEILVEQAYDLALLPGLAHKHDARASDGRLVQIKATMRGDALTFPCDPAKVPDYFIGVRVLRTGEIETVFNGPGWIAAQAVEGRAPTPNGLHSILVSRLRKQQALVPDGESIPLRPISLLSAANALTD